MGKIWCFIGYLFCLILPCACIAHSQRPLVVAVLGTRAEVIKMASTLNLLRDYYEPLLQLHIIYTGEVPIEQIDPVLKSQGVVVDTALFTSYHETAIFVSSTIPLLMQSLDTFPLKPAAVLVHGGTNSAYAAAMASLYTHTPVIHFEAGLRSWDISSPHPEEFNRRAISLVAALSFAPTASAKENLLRDGVDPDSIYVTGNTIVDALSKAISKDMTETDKKMFKDITKSVSVGKNFDKYGKRYIVLYISSTEIANTYTNNIATAVVDLAMNYTNVVFYCMFEPVNPPKDNIFQLINKIANVKLLPRMAYQPFVHLLRSASLIITESASVLEEASVLAVPSIFLR